MKRVISIIILIIVIIGLFSGLYVVKEMEQVIITQFGKPVGNAVTTAGVHFKIPLIQKAHFFDKRWLEWDGYPNQIPTKDKKYIWVDTYARWRIENPLKFYESVRDETGAQTRLDDVLDGETRNAIAGVELIEIVRSSNRVLQQDDTLQDTLSIEPNVLIELGRQKMEKIIQDKARELVKEYGIDLVDLRIKRILYIDKVLQKVYDRMISERQRIAAKFRSEGQGRSAKIQGEMDRELKRIESEAYRKAQEIIGTADAQATKIYADAYNQDPEFYSFLLSLESYETTIDSTSQLILKSDGDYLRYLKSMK